MSCPIHSIFLFLIIPAYNLSVVVKYRNIVWGVIQSKVGFEGDFGVGDHLDYYVDMVEDFIEFEFIPVVAEDVEVVAFFCAVGGVGVVFEVDIVGVAVGILYYQSGAFES